MTRRSLCPRVVGLGYVLSASQVKRLHNASTLILGELFADDSSDQA